MSAENPADVIEQAAEVAYKTGIYVNEYAAGQIARALHDAGLLADPADRDVKARLIAHRNVLRRMDRAEAEVAELRATVERCKALADEWESEGISCACGHDVGGSHNSNGCYAAVSYSPDVVRCDCSETDAQMDHEIAVVSLRAALDGEGEQ